ncbi:hypothetical protein ACP4OV_018003 [Aristida adscensionis]
MARCSSSLRRLTNSASSLPWMGRPRGKGKKPIESAAAAAADGEGDGSGGEEVAVAPTHKRRGRPQKRLEDGSDEEDGKVDAAEVDEDGDGIVEPAAPSKDSSKSPPEGAAKKRLRRRPKQSSDDAAEEDGQDPARSKRNGFRQNGSRRKSKPRRAAEAGVECK